MAFGFVIDYVIGLGIFGFVYWILDGGFVTEIIQADIATQGDVLNLYMYIWAGFVIVYLMFGAMWLPRRINEWRENQGGKF